MIPRIFDEVEALLRPEDGIQVLMNLETWWRRIQIKERGCTCLDPEQNPCSCDEIVTVLKYRKDQEGPFEIVDSHDVHEDDVVGLVKEWFGMS